LIKIEVNDDKKEKIFGTTEKIYLVAATLRPETMYGQTNCFILPEGEYGLYKMKQGELWVCSPHSARNMSYQLLTE
jgi:leucyl-tRNA synthetase